MEPGAETGQARGEPIARILPGRVISPTSPAHASAHDAGSGHRRPGARVTGSRPAGINQLTGLSSMTKSDCPEAMVVTTTISGCGTSRLRAYVILPNRRVVVSDVMAATPGIVELKPQNAGEATQRKPQTKAIQIKVQGLHKCNHNVHLRSNDVQP